MKATLTVMVATAVGVVLAQDTTQTQTQPTQTSSRAPTVHTITVGKASDQFDPMDLQASVGDIVTFQFFPPNHSVIRAEYKYPCVPYEDIHTDQKGFFSGFFPVNTISDNEPTWNLTINDTLPIFYYCSAPGSCIDKGMIGAINPNSSNQVSDQYNRAKSAQFMLQPGEPFPAEESAAISSAASATATATVTTTPISSPSTTPAPASHSLSSGAIAGIAIGGVLALALAGALFYFIGRSRSLSQSLRTRHQSGAMSEAGSYSTSRGGPLMPHYLSGAHSDHGSAVPRWSAQHPPPYGPELKSPHLGAVDETGSIRSNSPPIGTPYVNPFPPGQQDGQWYFAPAAVHPAPRPGVLGARSVELGGGQGIGRGHFSETGLDERGRGRRVHELEAQRGSLMRGEDREKADHHE